MGTDAQTTHDNRILTHTLCSNQPQKPDNNLCGRRPPTIKTWSIIASFPDFCHISPQLLTQNQPEKAKYGPEGISQNYYPLRASHIQCLWPTTPVRRLWKSPSFHCKASHLPACLPPCWLTFEPLPNESTVTDSFPRANLYKWPLIIPIWVVLAHLYHMGIYFNLLL